GYELGAPVGERSDSPIGGNACDPRIRDLEDGVARAIGHECVTVACLDHEPPVRIGTTQAGESRKKLELGGFRRPEGCGEERSPEETPWHRGGASSGGRSTFFATEWTGQNSSLIGSTPWSTIRSGRLCGPGNSVSRLMPSPW